MLIFILFHQTVVAKENTDVILYNYSVYKQNMWRVTYDNLGTALLVNYTPLHCICRCVNLL